MNERRTKNAIALGQNGLQEVDDFEITIQNPQLGRMSIEFTLGELEPVLGDLFAASDDLQKLKEWMESIAKDEPQSTVTLSSGMQMTCKLTEYPESAVKKTYRYLDELTPSPIAEVCITTREGVSHSSVLKVKHFINALYVALMMVGARAPEKLAEHWYLHTDESKTHEDYTFWLNKTPHWHQSLLTSPLIEWYLQSPETYTTANPQFQCARSIAYIVTMWADYGCIFWHNGISIGEITSLGINDLDFDFSDIAGLDEWYDDFYRLADEYREINEESENAEAVLQKCKEWHIRGFKLAQKIRKRLPLNIILLYVQSWDVGIGQLYFARDHGRIIFDSRKMKNVM